MVSRYTNGLILIPLSLGMAYFVPQVGMALCGDAWSDWLTYGFMGLGLFGFGLGVYRAWDATSIEAGKGSLAARWAKWSTRNMPTTQADD
ncbi:hypothetical protein [Paraburkholderia fungorum]|uniref:hypothetical protein n=1 Tax=Paraburkholderia fungorum TaxID=134537 RepID=UPI001622041E|nr:hypothetical protein [Paraburkholderia fungorum]MBB5547578.1 hypothetical protein [Paraburkholderia fungorum]